MTVATSVLKYSTKVGAVKVQGGGLTSLHRFGMTVAIGNQPTNRRLPNLGRELVWGGGTHKRSFLVDPLTPAACLGN